jgi:hypothetical protein
MLAIVADEDVEADLLDNSARITAHWARLAGQHRAGT